jgi:predicted HTH transcriptional regulator
MGRGIKKILDREPQTEFEELGTHFIATFKRKSYEASPPPKAGESSVKSSVKILDVIRQNRSVTAVELSQHLGLTLRAVEKQLANLKQDGVLRRIGADKGGHWEVVNTS